MVTLRIWILSEREVTFKVNIKEFEREWKKTSWTICKFLG